MSHLGSINSEFDSRPKVYIYVVESTTWVYIFFSTYDLCNVNVYKIDRIMIFCCSYECVTECSCYWFECCCVVWKILQVQVCCVKFLRYLLTPWSRVLPEKLKRPELLKKFPAFYGTLRFITAFTRARHLSLSWARLIQFMPPHPTSRGFILILSSHLRLGLPSGSFPQDSALKPCMHLAFPRTCYMLCPSQSSWFDHPNDIWWGVQSITFKFSTKWSMRK
jgi:hypothetical protein